MSAETRPLREELREAEPCDLWEVGEWQARFEGVAAGITAARREGEAGGSTPPAPGRPPPPREGLAERLGFRLAAAVRQVHGSRVVSPRVLPSPPGAELRAAGGEGARLAVAGPADGLVTAAPGILLTVTAADCVPVYLMDPGAGVVGLLHAGWRGIAAGVLEAGVARAREAGAEPERLWLHLGPAICGACYEVGPEVPEALGVGGARRRVDLRAVLAARAVGLGVAPERVTRSAWCTRCGSDRFHSHRGSRGAGGRMAAYLGRRAEAG